MGAHGGGILRDLMRNSNQPIEKLKLARAHFSWQLSQVRMQRCSKNNGKCPSAGDLHERERGEPLNIKLAKATGSKFRTAAELSGSIFRVDSGNLTGGALFWPHMHCEPAKQDWQQHLLPCPAMHMPVQISVGECNESAIRA
jgi:hypothetical protein